MRIDADFCTTIADPRMALDVAICGCSRLGAGWAITDRTVPHHYIAHWIAGEAVCEIDGVAQVMGPGMAWWLAPGVRHSLRPLDPRRGFRFHHLRFTCAAAIGHRALLLPRTTGVEACFSALGEAWAARDALATTAFRLRLAALCVHLLRLPTGDADGLDPALRDRLIAWVAERLPRPIHPRELAAQAGLSLDWFTRRFTATFHMPPRVWLLHRRVHWASALLASGGMSIGEAAARAGFANAALFSRQFRQVMGSGPRSWMAGR